MADVTGDGSGSGSEAEAEFVDPGEGGEFIVLDGSGDLPMDGGEEEEGEGEEEEIVPEREDAAAVFRGHSDAVLCVAVCPAGPGAGDVCSGGCDDAAFVWTAAAAAAEGVRLEGQAADSVCAAAYTADGQRLAVGDMAGAVRVYDVGAGQRYRLAHVLEGPAEIVWLAWHPRGPGLVAGAEDGALWVWNAAGGACLAVTPPHTAPTSCGAVTPDGKLLVAGHLDGTLKLWHTEGAALVPAALHYPAGILSLAVGRGGTIVAGCEDGSVHLAAIAGTGLRALASIPAGAAHEGPVEACAFVDLGTAELPVTAGGDGSLRIWDAQMQPRAQLSIAFGFVQIRTAPGRPYVAACDTGGVVSVWDARDATLLREFKGHRDTILGLALAPDGRSLATASDDHTCRLFLLDF